MTPNPSRPAVDALRALELAREIVAVLGPNAPRSLEGGAKWEWEKALGFANELFDALAAHPAPAVDEDGVRAALNTVNDAANDARHAGDYPKANALVRARVTLATAALAKPAQEASPRGGGEAYPEGFDASCGLPAEAMRRANAVAASLTGNRAWDVPCIAAAIAAPPAAQASDTPIAWITPDALDTLRRDRDSVPATPPKWRNQFQTVALYTRAQASDTGREPVAQIDYDAGYDRYYIPLPGGWEVQTKGKGSTFRIAEPDGSRLAIPDSPYLHETIERMARDIHSATHTPASEDSAGKDGERLDMLRAEQAAAVMPLIGPLVDAWEHLHSDDREAIEETGIAPHIEAIADAARGGVQGGSDA